MAARGILLLNFCAAARRTPGETARARCRQIGAAAFAADSHRLRRSGGRAGVIDGLPPKKNKMNGPKILELIEIIYRSATEPHLLPQVLAEIAKAIGAHSANSVQASALGVDDGYFHAYGLPGSAFDVYREYYHQHDFWHQASHIVRSKLTGCSEGRGAG